MRSKFSCAGFLLFWILSIVGAFCVSVGTASAQSADPGDNLVVCGNSNWGGLNQPRTQAMRDKLSNTAYFGPGGTYSESTFSFIVIGTPTTAALTANGCNVWFSGYDNDPSYTDLATFVANGGFVVAGCDTSGFDAACTGLGATVTNYSNTNGSFTAVAPLNPLACDGGVEDLSLLLLAAGGASGYFSSGVTLARYSDANAFTLVITNNVSSPNYVLTADIDLFTTNNANVTAGSLITSDQDKFIANTFKYAADTVTGLLANNGGPSCAKIPIVYSASINKSVDIGNVTTLPTTLSFTIDVENDGNAPLQSPVLADTIMQSGGSLTLTSGPALASGDSNSDGIIDTDETWSFTATYVVTQSNIDDAGDITNTASIAATSLPSLDSNTTTTTITGISTLSISKVADKLSGVVAGELITYTYTIGNTGNQTISDVTLGESHNASGPVPVPQNETIFVDNAPLGDSSDGGNNGSWDTLGPGDIITFTAQYTVTQQDVDTLQ